MRKSILLLAIALPAWCAVTNVQTVGVSRQQAVLSFKVINPAQCTMTVYYDAAKTIKAIDTDNSIFAGSENCVRTNNIVTGNTVTAVVGQRASAVSAAGTLQSRSLEIVHPYYAVITDTNDATSVTVPFTTGNIPWGETYPENVPFNIAGFGNWGYPDLDWSDTGTSKWYVDPISGMTFRRIPRDEFGGGGLNDFHPFDKYFFGGVFDVTQEQTSVAKWANLSNAKSITTAGPFASYSGTTQDPLFFSIDRVGQNIPYAAWYAVDDVQLNLYGSAPGCVGTDCQVSVCLATKYSPVTNACTSPEIVVTLPSTTAEVDVPASYPTYQYAGWNVGRALKAEEFGVWGNKNSWIESGTPVNVPVVNSAVTLSIGADGDNLLPQWADAGMKISINGVWYTLNTPTTSANFSLREAGINTSGTWMLANVGFRVRKTNASSNTINLSGSWMMATVQQPRISAGSEGGWCSGLDFPVSVAADGTTTIPTKRARLCMMGEYADLQELLLVADDGEIRYISPLKFGGVTVPMGTWSTTDPFTLYGYGNDTTNPAFKALFSAVYTPTNGCNYKTWTGNKYSTITPPTDCVVFTNKTPGSAARTVTEQISTNMNSNPVWDSRWDATVCQGTAGDNAAKCFNLAAISGNYAWFAFGPNDGMSFFAAFNIATGSFVKMLDSYSGTIKGYRFSGVHGGSFAYDGISTVGIGGKALYGQGLAYLSGPWVLPPTAVTQKSTDGITYTNDTSMTWNGAYGWTCGSNPQGVIGAQCVWLHLTTDEVCNIGSNATVSTEVTRWPCSWHAGWTAGPIRIGVDDFFGYYGGFIDGKAEKMRILTKTADGNGGWFIMAQRHATCDNPQAWAGGPSGDPQGSPPGILYFRAIDGQSVWANGWQMYASPPYACDGMIAIVDAATPLANTSLAPYISLAIQHGSGGAGPEPNTSTEGGTGIYRTGPGATLPTTAAHVTQNYQNVSWNAALNGDSTGPMEIYTDILNNSAPTKLTRSLSLDAHHMNPASGAYPEKNGVTLYNQTYALVAGTSYIYKLTSPMFGAAADQKAWRPVTVGTTFLWQDMSSAATGNVINDASTFQSCWAYKANECRTGSAAGDYFVWGKNLWMERGGCVVSTLKNGNPCTLAMWPQSGWITQSNTQLNDPYGTHIRRLTQGLVTPMSWYHYSAPHPTPDHKFMFMRSSYINGVADRPVMYKLPPAAVDDNIDRSRFRMTNISIGPGAGFRRIRFGYGENGPTTSFFCTSRQEACLTDFAIAPFAFASDTGLTPINCLAGCTLSIPGLSGRVLYYQIESSNAVVGPWAASPIQAITIN
ncbi:MAG: hypothetical protein NVS9B4_01160 [Candidatus Acidiferrum sp.]